MSSASPPSPLTTVAYDVCRASGVVLPGALCRRSASPGGTTVPAIIFCHGLLSHRDHNFAPSLAEALVRETGCAVFRFDFRCSAADAREPVYRYRFSGFEDDLDDLGVVVRQLRRDGMQPWLLLGHSRGANDVLLFASQHHELMATPSATPVGDDAPAASSSASTSGVAALSSKRLPPFTVIAVSARFHMPAMYTRIIADEIKARVASEGLSPWPTKKGDFVVTADDVRIVSEDMDMGKAVASIPPHVRILLCHGTEDEIIPVSDAHAFLAARPSIDLKIVEGAKHPFSGKPAMRALVQTVTAWVAARMADAAARETTPAAAASLPAPAAAVAAASVVSAAAEQAIVGPLASNSTPMVADKPHET